MRFCSAPQINLISVSVCLVILSFSDPISIAHIKYQYFHFSFVQIASLLRIANSTINDLYCWLIWICMHLMCALHTVQLQKTIKILHVLKLSKVDWIIVSVIHLAIAIKCIHTIKWRTNDTGEAESFFSVRLNTNDIKWDFCKATQKNKKNATAVIRNGFSWDYMFETCDWISKCFDMKWIGGNAMAFRLSKSLMAYTHTNTHPSVKDSYQLV